MGGVDLPDLHATEIDGVRTLWSPVPGPLRAGLVFRVGSADETMVTSGSTHFLEHLALFGVGRPGDHSNGHVDQTTMNFHCTGDEATLVDFMAAVTRQLADLPAARIEEERAILRAERAGRRTGVEETLNIWRYGAEDYGLAGLGELGLEHLDEPALRSWAAEVATTGNAVLWLSGPPPAALRLHLPAGEYRPAPDPLRSILTELPAYFTGPTDGVAMSAVLERGYANQALCTILRGRLVDELRTRRAVAYSPQTDYRPLTGTTARLLVVSDLVAGRQSDGVRPFLSALDELSDPESIDESELAEWRAALERDRSEPQAPLGRLVGQAVQLLLADELHSLERIDAELAAVSPHSVAEAARAARSTALARVPEGVRVSRAPWVPAPGSSFEPVTGRSYAALGAHAGTDVMVLSDQGLTFTGSSAQLTVPLAATVAVQCWPDGRRVLVASDANRVVVEPTLWEDGGALVSDVDRLWPGSLRVDMGERPPDQIPAPHPADPTPATAPPAADAARGAKAGAWIFYVLAGLFLVAAIAFQLPLGGVAAAIFGLSGYNAQRRLRTRNNSGSRGR